MTLDDLVRLKRHEVKGLICRDCIVRVNGAIIVVLVSGCSSSSGGWSLSNESSAS